MGSNLFGDILSDLGPGVTGTIAIAPSGNINPERDFPSMFEPVHGSAPDIAGTGKADPTAAIMSVALLLEHRGFPELAGKIVQAVTQDVGSRAEKSEARSTSHIGQAIRALLV